MRHLIAAHPFCGALGNKGRRNLEILEGKGLFCVFSISVGGIIQSAFFSELIIKSIIRIQFFENSD